MVHPDDSLLGTLSRAQLNGITLTGLPGLQTTYSTMIKAAFQPEYWNNSDEIVVFQNGPPTITNRPDRPLTSSEFTQMEANFSLFFGLAVQVYESTLVANDTPFDKYREGQLNAMTDRQKQGMEIFLNQGKCIDCHGGAEFTNASVGNITGVGEAQIELMDMAVGRAFYDNGFYNIGVRPTAEDIGRGGTAPFINPLTGQPYPLSFSRLALLKRDGLLPQSVADFTPDLPAGTGSPDPDRVAVDGAMKIPSVRTTQLTGPFFFNGGQSTLRQVVDFYTRGGDFHDQNINNLDPDIDNIGHLIGHPDRKNALVDFLIALTDERVRQEKAPFDHPQLFVPSGQTGDDHEITGSEQLKRNGFKENEEVIESPAVGAGGRPASGLPPLETFLGLDPFQP